jgi:hypothetical protein
MGKKSFTIEMFGILKIKNSIEESTFDQKSYWYFCE